MKKVYLWFLSLPFCLIVYMWIQWPHSLLRYTQCDVGQGDGLVVSEGFSQMVVDVGPDNGLLNVCLGRIMPFWDHYIEVIVITHSDSDHMGNLQRLLKSYQVGMILTTEIARDLVESAASNKVRVIAIWQGQKISFGSFSGEVLWPPYTPEETGAAEGQTTPNVDRDINQQSLVMRLEISGDLVARDNQSSLWLAGDSNSAIEHRLLSQGLVRETSILKVGHHGSSTASSEPFLAILRPRQVWISVAKNNRYGHPAPIVLERFARLGYTIRRTDQLGTFDLELPAVVRH